MSAENPFKSSIPKIESKNESTEKPPEQAAFAEWCEMNGVEDQEMPKSLSLEEKTVQYSSIFRLGAENLHNGFIARAEGDLNLDVIKSELAELRAQGDVAAIGTKEQEVAGIFQKVISSYEYEGSTNHPREILTTKQMNCVGASLIGGTLLEDVGISVLQASAGSHCFLVMVTSDNRVLWQDMQDGKEMPELFNQELTDEKIKGVDESGALTHNDIVAFAREPKGEMKFLTNIEWWKNQPITVKPFLSGMEQQELINTGFQLSNAGKSEEALEILEVARQEAPEDETVYLGMARALRRLHRSEEAVENCKKALEIDPTYSYAQEEMDEILSSMPTKTL
jgi:tetratricopeptide (TPR) repeat protein